MGKLKLFIDGSADPHLKIGYGAYLAVNETVFFDEALKKNVKIKRFTNTSSTKLELETLLWALNDINAIHMDRNEIVIYTDSQNIIGLKSRRMRFEQNDYCSKNGKLIRNHELYKEFYRVIDQLNCTFIQLKGHKSMMEKNNIDKCFMLVDRALRSALRKTSKV